LYTVELELWCLIQWNQQAARIVDDVSQEIKQSPTTRGFIPVFTGHPWHKKARRSIIARLKF